MVASLPKEETAVSTREMSASPKPQGSSESAALEANTHSQVKTDFKPNAIFYAAMSTLALLTFVVSIDATALAVALPVRSSLPSPSVFRADECCQIVAEKLHGTGLQSFWSGTGFLLCAAVFQPVIGGISSLVGRSYVLMGSITFFLAGCIGCGCAQNFETLLIARAIQGAGGGGVVVMTEVVVCDMIPLRQRGEWFGLLSGMYAVGTVLGPIIGGAFAEHVTWVCQHRRLPHFQIRTRTDSHSDGSSGSTFLSSESLWPLSLSLSGSRLLLSHS